MYVGISTFWLNVVHSAGQGSKNGELSLSGFDQISPVVDCLAGLSLLI